MPAKKINTRKNYKRGGYNSKKMRGGAEGGEPQDTAMFQSEEFIKAQAMAFAELVAKHKNKSLFKFLTEMLGKTPIGERHTPLLRNGYFDEEHEEHETLLGKFTLQEFLLLELLCGRFLSLYEKNSRNCVTKVGEEGTGYFTADNYAEIFAISDLGGKKTAELLAEDDREKKMKALKKSLEKAKANDPFFLWVGETFDLFKKIDIPPEQERFDEAAKLTVEDILRRANKENLFAEPKKGVTDTPAQLIRKWGVVIFDLLMKQSVDMLGEGLSAKLGALQKGYMDQRISQFGDVLKQATTVCKEKPPIQLLQEVNKEYGLPLNFFYGKPESRSVINIPPYTGTEQETVADNSELCVVDTGVTMYASFHAESSGGNTIGAVEEVFDQFEKAGGAQILIMGIDSNAKNEEKHKALNALVKKDRGNISGHIYTIDNDGRTIDRDVEYKTLYPTSVGFRTLLQSQLTKAGESFKFSIDRLIIFCKSGKPSVELVEDFYKVPRTCLTPNNPSDHVPMLFKVTIAGEAIAYDEHILVYNMAGPNTNLAEYYTSGGTTDDEIFVAMELAPSVGTGVALTGQGGVPVGPGPVGPGTGLGGGARRVKKSRKKRGRRGKKSKRGSRRN
jgi:hypothetical protein